MYSILPKIDSPKDLKPLTISELEILSEEIRNYIVEVITAIGGHLAPSLGVVELTLALHYVFEAPKDKLVWDVGHQGYVHKVVTGRREELKRIRQEGGISGFLKRTESEYDTFGAGHASTSISAALGMATARDLQGKDFKVIAVTGDGAMTGGLAYEGLNNAGAAGKDIIIVLNDNKMSISPNVGAISTYLSNIMVNPVYNRLKDEIKELGDRLSHVGKSFTAFASKVEESLKNLVVPGLLFEELGFEYIGPINGHSLKEIIPILEKAKLMKGPILIHALTHKGKGYKVAEENPVMYHGVKPSKKSSTKKPPAYTEVFGKTLVKLAEKNEKICAITAAMEDGTGLKAFRENFPDRFFDVGIAEQHAVTFASGLGASGFKPVAAIYSTFLQRAYDQIIREVALKSLPVVFCLDRAGVVGEDGPTHHGAFDLSYFNCIPNVVVTAPKDARELQDLLYTAINQNENPFVIRYPRDSVPEEVVNFDRDFNLVDIPSWEILIKGSGVVLLAVGAMVKEALGASRLLAKQGCSVGVVNCRFTKPLDEKILLMLANSYDLLVTVEENSVLGGFGDSVMQFLTCHEYKLNKIYQLGIEDQFVGHAPRRRLLDQMGLSAEKITEKIGIRLGLRGNSGESERIVIAESA